MISPQIDQALAQIVIERRFNPHGFTGGRMIETQRGGMQKQPVQP
jgi:hypothetical protein